MAPVLGVRAVEQLPKSPSVFWPEGGGTEARRRWPEGPPPSGNVEQMNHPTHPCSHATEAGLGFLGESMRNRELETPKEQTSNSRLLMIGHLLD